jgi:autotransporter-associated beta strand protein
VQVFSSAQLAGTGTVAQPVTCSGGSVSPGVGTAIGTLFLQQGLTLNNGSGMTFKLSNQPSTGDVIDFEPAVVGGELGTIGGLQTSGTSYVSFTGTPVPNTSTPYVIIDHYHSTTGNRPGFPGATSLKRLTMPGYSVDITVPDTPQNDFSTFPPTQYWQVLAQFTGPTEWTSSGGSWSDNGNWSNGRPAEIVNQQEGSPAMFGTLGSGMVAIQPNDPNYVTVLILNNSSSSYTIAAPSGGTLSLTGKDTSGADAGSAIVEVVSGSHSITAPVALGEATDISMFDPAARLTIAGAISGSGALSLSGSGTLILSGNNTFSGPVNLRDSATLVLTNPSSLIDGASITIGDPALFSSPAPIAFASPASTSAVPEPQTITMLLMAGAGFTLLYGIRRRLPVSLSRKMDLNDSTGTR